MAHPLFGPEVRLMLQENDTAEMKTFCETLHPATVAEALAEEYNVDEVWRVLSQTDIRHQAAIFEYFPIDWQVKLVEGTGRQNMAKLIERMAHDDRVDLLRRLNPRVAEGLLRLVDEAERRDIATLREYAENTAGAVMTTDYAWLPANITVADALDRLRLQAPDRETIYYVYVLDEQRKLLGVISLRNLIMAPRQAILRAVMEQDTVTVKATDDREQVAQEMAHYDLLAIPVVDEEGRLLGIVTHDDVIDVVVQEATEDVHRMGGVGPMVENYLEANFFKVWWKRASWLSVLFVAELFTFTALSFFDEAINEVVVLALFVPLILSTGGNSGSQAATLTTRALALGHIHGGDFARVLRHELAMGIVLGLTLGTFGFVRALATREDVRGNQVHQKEAFVVEVPKQFPQAKQDEDRIHLPAGSRLGTNVNKDITVILPKGTNVQVHQRNDVTEYQFPADCHVRTEAVDSWMLAKIISMAVASSCLWGTLVGSMLPLLFRRLGVDPGIASSPFVATFVDVTGIMIYFSIASQYLHLR